MKKCPKCGNKKFYVIAHVTQEWIVDENGYCQEVEDDCVDITYEPDDYDPWECTKCGYEDEGLAFNVSESEVRK